MKKLIHTAFFLALCSLSASSQNYVHKTFVIPARPVISPFIKIKSDASGNSIKNIKLNIVLLEDDVSFISNLPVVNLNKMPGRLPIQFFTELSLNDMLENSVNTINGNILYTYDGHITELFRDAPSIVKIHCVIPF